MLKRIKKKMNNQGSSFVMVVITLAFVAILVASIIVAVGYSYRLKSLDLNNKNNFYYVERALDEMNSGIGTITMDSLKTAYNDTLDTIVYFDTDKNAYVTRDEDEANLIMKDKFMNLLKDNDALSSAKIYDTLNSFITDQYSASNEDGIKLLKPSEVDPSTPALKIEYVYENPDATYKVINSIVIKNVTVTRKTPKGYKQSITVDLKIDKPNFDVSFSDSTSHHSDLYDFAMLADMGIEATNNSNVVVSGNVYAGSDYYNKSYNQSDATKVSSYDVASQKYLECDGLTYRSKYSGILVDGSKMTIQSNKVIVPGTISAYNVGDLVLSGKSDGKIIESQIWCDNIVLGGYSDINNNASSMTIVGDIYASDDLEVNSNYSNIAIRGKYYGYNFSTTADVNNLSESSKVNSDLTKKHMNSSSIVVNGQNATLDLSKLNSLVVAGRSYIETSKTTSAGLDDAGVYNETYTYSPVDDYMTGESISVKSNQLAYIDEGYSIDEMTNIGLLFFDAYMKNKGYKYDEIFADPEVLPYSISGNVYYFYNFKSPEVKDEFIRWYASIMEKNGEGSYKEVYAQYFTDITNYKDFTIGDVILPETNGVTDLSKVYSTGALSIKTGTTLNITAPENKLDIMSDLGVVNNKSGSYSELYTMNLELNNKYRQMKYVLNDINDSEDAAALATLTDMDITPLTYYIDFASINNGNIKETDVELKSGYHVWISKSDINVDASDAKDGVVKGIIITMGDVTFDKEIDRFEGMIISGSKIKVDSDVDGLSLVSNPEIIRAMLFECENNTDYSYICKAFKKYLEDSNSSENSGSTENINNIVYSDITCFENWKRNVE